MEKQSALEWAREHGTIKTLRLGLDRKGNIWQGTAYRYNYQDREALLIVDGLRHLQIPRLASLVVLVSEVSDDQLVRPFFMASYHQVEGWVLLHPLRAYMGTPMMPPHHTYFMTID